MLERLYVASRGLAGTGDMLPPGLYVAIEDRHRGGSSAMSGMTRGWALGIGIGLGAMDFWGSGTTCTFVSTGLRVCKLDGLRGLVVG